MNRKSLIGLIFVLLGMVFHPSLASSPTNPCRDAQGNEICVNWNPGDRRVNLFDAQQTITAYCREDHGLDVYAIINEQGVYEFTASPQNLADALLTATLKGKNTLVKAMTRYQVYALTSNQFQLNDTGSGYAFVFASTTCGALPNTTTQPITPTTAKGTAVTVTQLNLRTAPNKNANRIAIIPANTTVQVLGTAPSWLWIKIALNGQTGWLYTYYTSLRNADLSDLPTFTSPNVTNAS